MTIGKNNNKITYLGTGTNNEYDYDFVILTNKSCVVYKLDTSNSRIDLTEGVDYELSATGVDIESGTVTLTENLEDGYTLVIYRSNSFLQETDYANQRSYFLDKLEDSLDILTIYTQQLYEAQERSIQIAITEDGPVILPEEDRANKVLGFDEDGNPDYFVPETYHQYATEEETVVGEIDDKSVSPKTLGRANLRVKSIAELRLYSGYSDTDKADVLGYYTAGDGGGGPQRIWFDGQTPGFYVDNGRSIIVPNGGDGSAAWLWGDIDLVSVAWCGAVGDGVTSDTAALVGAHSLGVSLVYGAGKNYVVDNANLLKIVDGATYDGQGCTITVPVTATKPDTGDGFGRFNNSIFYRDSTEPLTAILAIYNFNVNIESKWYNFIGGSDIALRENNIGFVHIYGNNLQNFGTTPGQGAIATTLFESGALTQLNGYSVDIHDNHVEDCGNGIVAFNCYICRLHDNNIRFSGVSRDFTSWANTGAILVRGSLHQDVHDNEIYVTGGTAVFLSTAEKDIEDVKCKDNKIIGCGLSAIGSGMRSALTTTINTDSIELTGNKVQGWCCGINATLHSGISVNVADGNGSTIKNVTVENSVDYLAPWETFNTSTNEVDNSYNGIKSINNDPGSQYGVSIISDSAYGLIDVVVGGSVLNHQRAGYILQSIFRLKTDITAINCGWSRNLSNVPYSVQQSFFIDSIAIADITAKAIDQSRGVNLSNAFCTPMILTDALDSALSLSVTRPNNQERALKLVNSAAGNKLSINQILFDNPTIDAGYVNYIDDSGGVNTRNTNIIWINAHASVLTALITGSRSLPAGQKHVGMSYTSLSPKTVTLYSAAFYKNSVISFSADQNTLTITPNGVETIDGATGSIVLTVGTSTSLYSNGTEWFRTTT